ncbi:MAG: hypothetical protein CMP06_12170 [Xanthomonadales bacterium]|nr:hypothetical protein [Xanthomonadales bacterium]
MPDSLPILLAELIRPLLTGNETCQAWTDSADTSLVQALTAQLPMLGWVDADARRTGIALIDARSRPLANHTVAYWRDLGAAHLFVLLDRHAGFEQNLIALGLTLLARSESHEVWAFDIGHYKRKPDWLNPKYWAHPERWAQARW